MSSFHVEQRFFRKRCPCAKRHRTNVLDHYLHNATYLVWSSCTSLTHSWVREKWIQLTVESTYNLCFSSCNLSLCPLKKKEKRMKSNLPVLSSRRLHVGLLVLLWVLFPTGSISRRLFCDWLEQLAGWPSRSLEAACKSKHARTHRLDTLSLSVTEQPKQPQQTFRSFKPGPHIFLHIS